MEFELGILWVAFGACLLSIVGTAIVLIYKHIERFIYAKDIVKKSKAKSKVKSSPEKQPQDTAKNDMQESSSVPWFIEKISLVSRVLLHLTTLFITMAFVLLLYYFLTSNMDIKYVLVNSNEDYVWYYKVVGLWSGEKGSLLLWLWLVSLIVSVEEFLRFRLFGRTGDGSAGENEDDAPAADPSSKNSFFSTPDPEHYAITKLIMLLFLLGFIVLMIEINPFERIENVDPRFKGGLGLNFALKTEMMIYHPPVEFLAYSLTLVPFASSLSYLLTKNREAYETSYLWARLSWLFYTVGICFGAIWAYSALGWGGYWSWDPVEVGNLLPWLILTAFLHAMVYFQRKGDYGSLLSLLGILAFATTLLATFITRSGFWTSVHAYTVGNDLAGKFISILNDSEPSSYFFKVILLSLILGEMLFAWKIFHRRFPEFREKLEDGGARGHLLKLFEKRRLSQWKKREFIMVVLDLLFFAWNAFKVYIKNYHSTLRGFTREKGLWSAFPIYFSLLLLVLFVLALLNIVVFMELAFLSSNIALNLELGLSILILLALLLPLSWKILMEEETELEFSLKPTASTFMAATIALLFIITIFTTALLMRSINTSNAQTFESRFPFFMVPMMILLMFCSGRGLLKFNHLLYSSLVLFFLSLVLYVAFSEEILLYLPLLGMGMALSLVGIDHYKPHLDKEKEGPPVVGTFVVMVAMVGLIFWGSGHSEIDMFGNERIVIVNNPALTVIGFVFSLFLLVIGRVLELMETGKNGKRTGKLRRLFRDREYSTKLLKRARSSLFKTASHIIHLGLLFIILGYVMTQNYETSEQFRDVAADEGWNFEGHGFVVDEVTVRRGAFQGIEKIEIEIDVYDDELDLGVFSLPDNASHPPAYHGLDRIATLHIVVEWAEDWDSNTSDFHHAYKQHIKVSRFFVKDFYFILGSLILAGGSTVIIGEEQDEPQTELNITGLSFELKLIKGTMFLWSGSGLMVVGVAMRAVFGWRQE